LGVGGKKTEIIALFFSNVGCEKKLTFNRFGWLVVSFNFYQRNLFRRKKILKLNWKKTQTACLLLSDVDAACISSHASELFDCGYQKAEKYLKGSDVETLLCR
jgi:hypothetical protein